MKGEGAVQVDLLEHLLAGRTVAGVAAGQHFAQAVAEDRLGPRQPVAQQLGGACLPGGERLGVGARRGEAQVDELQDRLEIVR